MGPLGNFNLKIFCCQIDLVAANEGLHVPLSEVQLVVWAPGLFHQDGYERDHLLQGLGPVLVLRGYRHHLTLTLIVVRQDLHLHTHQGAGSDKESVTFSKSLTHLSTIPLVLDLHNRVMDQRLLAFSISLTPISASPFINVVTTWSYQYFCILFYQLLPVLDLHK